MIKPASLPPRYSPSRFFYLQHSECTIRARCSRIIQNRDRNAARNTRIVLRRYYTAVGLGGPRCASTPYRSSLLNNAGPSDGKAFFEHGEQVASGRRSFDRSWKRWRSTRIRFVRTIMPVTWKSAVARGGGAGEKCPLPPARARFSPLGGRVSLNK